MVEKVEMAEVVEKVVSDILFLRLLVILGSDTLSHPFTLSHFHSLAGSPRRRLERDTRRKRLPPSLLRFKPEP